MKTTIKKIETIKFPVRITAEDIAEGECGLATKCMVRVAVERVLRTLDPSMPNHHTRVDAGHIRFNYKGRRCVADTPRTAKAALIRFDLEAKKKREAARRGVEFKSQVEPFAIKVIGELRGKLSPTTRKRKDNINQARRRRAEAGQKPKRYTLHKRVVGFA
jgi:hypothetical protein